eukprot:88240-Pyramimonas_sp.AAC.1
MYRRVDASLCGFADSGVGAAVHAAQAGPRAALRGGAPEAGQPAARVLHLGAQDVRARGGAQPQPGEHAQHPERGAGHGAPRRRRDGPRAHPA